MLNGRPADVPRDRFCGFKDDTLQEYKTNVASAILAHAFTDDFSVKNTLRYGDYYRKYRTNLMSGVNNAAQTLTLSQALRDRRVKIDTKAAFVQDQLEITKQWKLLAGIRYDDFRADQTDKLNPSQ